MPMVNSGMNGCPAEDKYCGGGISGVVPKCGDHGVCTARLDLQEASCVCAPGWRGSRCDKSEFLSSFIFVCVSFLCTVYVQFLHVL